jgi:hypothetical protein
MIRDLALGIGLFLQGRTVEESWDTHFNHDISAFKDYFDVVTLKDLWGEEESGLGGQNHHMMVYPSLYYRSSFDFQIQFWALFNNTKILDCPTNSGANRIIDLLDGTVLRDPVAQEHILRPIDHLFWSYGIHEWDLWKNGPFTDLFYNNIHKTFRDYMSHFTYPAVWVSMNTWCVDKVIQTHKMRVPLTVAVNKELGERLKTENFPYYDADLFLRGPQSCNVSGDGRHVKMWVDLYRAQTFFNYLCDENNEWVGNSTAPFLL